MNKIRINDHSELASFIKSLREYLMEEDLPKLNIDAFPCIIVYSVQGGIYVGETITRYDLDCPVCGKPCCSGWDAIVNWRKKI